MVGSLFWFTRKVVFGATSLFSIAVITLGSLTMNNGSVLYESALFWIITGAITLVTLPVMLFVTIFRNGALTSTFTFEVGWTFLLWILWVAVGGSSISLSGLQASCSRYAPFVTGADSDIQECKNSSAISILGFLSCFFLMLYNLLAFFLCCHGKVSVSATETDTDTNFTDLEINDTQIIYDKKVSPTDPKKSPPPGLYEIPIISPQNSVSLNQANIPYTATTPYPQHEAATGSLSSTGEERLYPNRHPPPYEPASETSQQTADYSYTQAGIPYTATSPYYCQPRAATRSYHSHGRTRHGSLTGIPPVYLMPLTSDGTVVLIRPLNYA